MIDVDHFKTVNDVHGHLAGDAALQAVAAHVRRTIRAQDLLARFGGDEFVALLVEVDPGQAAAVTARMTDMSQLLVGGQQLSLSIGWACQASDIAALLGRADTALYAAKEAGRGRAVAMHDLIPGQRVHGPGAALPSGTRHSDLAATVPVATATATAAPTAVKTRVQRELHAALVNDQLTLQYQPRSRWRPGGCAESRLWCAGITPSTACATPTRSCR